MIRGCGYASSSMFQPQDEKQKEIQTTTAADTDNDTSFEIDEPEDEEVIEQLRVEDETDDGQHSDAAIEDVTKDDGMSTPTNDMGAGDVLQHRKSITGSTVRKKSVTLSASPTTTRPDEEAGCSSSRSHVIAKTLSPQQSSLSHSLPNESNSEDEMDSDVSCDSYTFSSTPTTADVADVSSGNLNRYSNGSGGSSSSQKLRKHLTACKQTPSPYLADDNISGSLATTTTELDVVDQHHQQQQQQQQSQHPASSNSANLRRGSSIRVNPTVLNIPTMLLTHPSAALQENTTLKVSSSLELPTTSGSHHHHRHHQRSLSAASHRSVTSQHSVHTANTSLSIVEPKSRIWSSLSWICVRFQVNIKLFIL